MTKYDVLENLKKLIGTEFDYEEVIIAFGEFEQDGETEVIVNESHNVGYDMIAYINTYDSTQFLFVLDEDEIIVDVYMYD